MNKQLILLLICTASLNASAYDGTLRIALGQSYQEQLNNFDSCHDKPCTNFTVGNDYQRLEWLQNGKVDGAIISSITLNLLHRDWQEDFLEHFIVWDKVEFKGISRQTQHYQLQAKQDTFEQFLNQLLVASNKPHKPTIYLPSHLSPALPQLFEYVATWLGDRVTNSQFWENFINQIGFYIHNDTLDALHQRSADEPIFVITPVKACSEQMPSICLKKSGTMDKERACNKVCN